MIKSHRKALGECQVLSETVGFGGEFADELRTVMSPAIDRSGVFDAPSVMWFM